MTNVLFTFDTNNEQETLEIVKFTRRVRLPGSLAIANFYLKLEEWYNRYYVKPQVDKNFK